MSALDIAKAAAASASPRVIIAATIENLRQLQTMDSKFPQPLTEKSLHGLLGDFVDIAHPTIEGDKQMLMFQMLPLIGVLMGDSYYLPFGADKHFANTFSLVIARTADGKGQAKHACEEAILTVDPAFKIHSNPASGEGLVRMLSNQAVVTLTNGHKRRVAIHNSEMASTFIAVNRKESTLGQFLRNAFDSEAIETYRSDARKSNTADNYLLGFVGTITPKELEEVMPPTGLDERSAKPLPVVNWIEGQDP